MDERDRLVHVTERLGLNAVGDESDRRVLDPIAAVDALRGAGLEAALTGPFDRRVLLARQPRHDHWLVASLNGQALERYPWPTWVEGRLRLRHPGMWLSEAIAATDVLTRFLRPRMLLTALYHEENFPLPRFALGISNLAHAARSTLSGEVRLLDMQLGATLDDILMGIREIQPDILGVSATFGQYDLLVELLQRVMEAEEKMTVVVGGSLPARTQELLLNRFPRTLVAHGAGESVIMDLVARYHGDLALGQVRGIAFRAGDHRDGQSVAVTRRNARPTNRLMSDTTPELDLLAPTFARGGVAQLEASRGCTNSCSFCPRSHKGNWASAPENSLDPVLTAMSDVFERFPATSRTVYLVDEEFLGGDPDAVSRAMGLGQELSALRYRWESSCRVDQVVDPTEERDWHIERAGMWRALANLGLRRMLFGVESGVTTILDRFNKETTGPQNELAIRTLSALGIPTRFTYITFDHLMTMDELRETAVFQGRTDLVLEPLPDLSVEEIVDGVGDEDFVRRHSANRPFYASISYMLVSMECLIGAPYTRRVHEAGLTGLADPLMGRFAADFLDWRIGVASDAAQRWVDRNFALDYSLKSFEKVLDGTDRHHVHEVRVALRESAYVLLQEMIELISTHQMSAGNREFLSSQIFAAMDRQWVRLDSELTPRLDTVVGTLPTSLSGRLRSQVDGWKSSAGWRLINSSDAC